MRFFAVMKKLSKNGYTLYIARRSQVFEKIFQSCLNILVVKSSLKHLQILEK
jgi:hypothetical protein